MSKISKEELEKLQDQEKKKNALKHDLGLLSTQKHALNHVYSTIVEEQEKDKKALEEKYGKINIDLKDGSYKEIKDEESK
tara:strand:- start:441 stop:680 length:240 start_codon:yes stop_codon:yes gene_type:complete